MHSLLARETAFRMLGNYFVQYISKVLRVESMNGRGMSAEEPFTGLQTRLFDAGDQHIQFYMQLLIGRFHASSILLQRRANLEMCYEIPQD